VRSAPRCALADVARRSNTPDTWIGLGLPCTSAGGCAYCCCTSGSCGHRNAFAMLWVENGCTVPSNAAEGTWSLAAGSTVEHGATVQLTPAANQQCYRTTVGVPRTYFTGATDITCSGGFLEYACQGALVAGPGVARCPKLRRRAAQPRSLRSKRTTARRAAHRAAAAPRSARTRACRWMARAGSDPS
jgi:hypothetical protein